MLSQYPIYGAVFPIANIHKPMSTMVKMKVALFTNISTDLCKMLLPIPIMHRPCFCRGLSFKGRNAFAEDPMMIALKWKMRLVPGHSGYLVPLNKQLEKGLLSG